MDSDWGAGGGGRRGAPQGGMRGDGGYREARDARGQADRAIRGVMDRQSNARAGGCVYVMGLEWGLSSSKMCPDVCMFPICCQGLSSAAQCTGCLLVSCLQVMMCSTQGEQKLCKP